MSYDTKPLLPCLGFSGSGSTFCGSVLCGFFPIGGGGNTGFLVAMAGGWVTGFSSEIE